MPLVSLVSDAASQLRGRTDPRLTAERRFTEWTGRYRRYPWRHTSAAALRQTITQTDPPPPVRSPTESITTPKSDVNCLPRAHRQALHRQNPRPQLGAWGALRD